MDIKIQIRQLSVSYNGTPALRSITLDIYKNCITGFMGPAGSGKSTLITLINRMIDFEEGVRYDGEIRIDGINVLDPAVDVVALRRRIGMVFAVPLPLPRSIFDNIAYGPRLKGITNMTDLYAIVEDSLKKAFLFDEVKDRLMTSAMKLSGGQQQRLCLARTLALQPDIILLDEPCSGLDPISTAKIEEALSELKKDYTIILVSNNTKQIARTSDYAAFFYMGELIEFGETPRIFTNPSQKKTEDYIQGKFG
ncbi:MAG: phosphate ABC transporter ATP-binding protein [Desulfobacterota bacterium]|nr:phosphate ABC transporter ATP-binding protein [Thermodesulfobacteriota bacterium]